MKTSVIVVIAILVSVSCFWLFQQMLKPGEIVKPGAVGIDSTKVIVKKDSSGIASKVNQPKQPESKINEDQEMGLRLDRSGKYITIYDLWFRKYSKQLFGYQFDWLWFKAQGVAESQLNPEASSYCHAKGIMQILPATYQDIVKKFPWIENNILSPRWNIAAGIAYDRQMWDFWDKFMQDEQEHLRFMFGSYNAGYGNVYKAFGILQDQFLVISWQNIISRAAPNMGSHWRYNETNQYVKRVFEVHSGLGIRGLEN